MTDLDERTIKLMCAYFIGMKENYDAVNEKLDLDDVLNLMKDWKSDPSHANKNKIMLFEGLAHEQSN